MFTNTKILLEQYTEILQKIYGNHLRRVILYGSYARGDYTKDSDIDIMILLDMSDMDIKPIAKSEIHFQKWVDVYPFCTNVMKEGVKLFEAA